MIIFIGIICVTLSLFRNIYLVNRRLDNLLDYLSNSDSTQQTQHIEILDFIKNKCGNPVYCRRDPTLTDNFAYYSTLQVWVNTKTQNIFILIDKFKGRWEVLCNKYRVQG